MYINTYYSRKFRSYQKNPFTENTSSLCLSINSNKIGRSGFITGRRHLLLHWVCSPSAG